MSHKVFSHIEFPTTCLLHELHTEVGHVIDGIHILRRKTSKLHPLLPKTENKILDLHSNKKMRDIPLAFIHLLRMGGKKTHQKPHLVFKLQSVMVF